MDIPNDEFSESEISDSDGDSVASDMDALSEAESDSTHFSDDEPDIIGSGLSDSESETGDEDDFPQQIDWDQEFKDDAIDYEPHAVNSEIPLPVESTSLDILQTFITEAMVDIIIEESNRYAEQKQIPKFTPLTRQDFWRFFAINLSMGLVKKSSVADYWAVKTTIPTPFFNSVMTRDRYFQILRSLHFVNNATVPANNTDRFVKLGSFMDDLFQNIRNVINPGEYLCIDESFVPFKGRLSIKQYNPKKRARFGILLYKLADCNTKMIMDILPYQGKSTKLKNKQLQTQLGFGGAAVLTLLDSHLNKGHRVVTDNYFNSPTLARMLKRKNTYMLGTVQKRRKGMPKCTKMNRKMQKGEVETFSDGDILLERWNDRRDVCMINTFMPHSMNLVQSRNPNNTREKPGTVILYNSKMGAIDDADKVTAPLRTTRKSYKWYRKVAFHLMDIAVYDSFLAYKNLQRKPNLKHKIFVEDIINQILSKYRRQKSARRGRPTLPRDEERLTGQHFPRKVQKENGKSSKADCFYCRTVEKKRKSTVFGCAQCKKRLCIGPEKSCFELYHTQSTLRKVSRQHGINLASAPSSSSSEFQLTDSPFMPRNVSTPVPRELLVPYSRVTTSETESENQQSQNSSVLSISLLA